MADTWQQIRKIFDAASQMRPEERAAYLERACEGDDDLRSEVESLLSSFDRSADFLEKPLLEAPTEEITNFAQGEMIGHYEIVERIGSGGMGEVYLAKDTHLDRLVAVKVLNKKIGANENNVRRFIREAKSASALNHPNILTIFEAGEVEGSHYIVSEYVKGETLRYILNHRKLDLANTVDIASQIADALCAAHSARIIHRDIKPENIVVREDGYVKVLDFGLAKLISDTDQGPSDAERSRTQNTTAAGIILGTVNYMSPEQAKGRNVDERTDIFSLGVVLYEMLTGTQPFAGDSIPETFANLIERPPEPIDSYITDVPDELERITSRMLEKEPEKRYQAISEAADDLRSLASSSLQAIPRRRQPDNRTAVVERTTGSGANTTTENTGSHAQWYRRWPVLAALGAVLLAAIGLGGYLWRQKDGSSIEIRSVAVMPFVNETGDPEVEYLSDGMTDTLISSLSELPDIKVKARTLVFRYKGKEMDPKAIGKELGVQAIISGRVVQRDGRTNVSLEVVDTGTEDVIFSTKYDKSQAELVTLQSDIARDVSGKLRNKLSGAEQAKVMKAHTTDPEALQLYLQGQFHRHKGGRSNVLLAADYFNKAIEKDPNYALAYAGLALNYSSYQLYNLVGDWRKAVEAAKRAAELDDSLAEAHVAVGQFVGDAEKEFRRAVELNPNYADARVALCAHLTMTRRFDEGIAECIKAQELDPTSAVVTMHLGAAYFFARRPDEAIAMETRAHEMDPTLWVPVGYLGGAQTLKGQYTDAAATFRKAINISDGSPNTKSHLAYALAKAGQRDEALKIIGELKRQAVHEHINSFHFAVPYIGLGNKDEAFFWLGKGIDEGTISFNELNVHPWFDELRSDTRFAALLLRADPTK